MLYVVNFADEKYRDKQILNTKSAYEKGKADKVFEYSPKDLTELKLKFPAHFEVKRGYGLWFWKPYVILKALERITEGDYLFYCDSGSVFIDDIHKLIPDMQESGEDIMVFELPLLNKYFTKKETFNILNSEDYSGNQLLGTFILLRKSDKSIHYMEEWLQAMSDIRVLDSKIYLPGIKNPKNFRAHREDQSILTILCKKWNIKAHRDPSDFGIFPWQYLRAGGYHRKKYSNSHYPVILLCVRRNDPVLYEQNYYKALRKYKIGLNNELIARIKLLPMYMRHCGRLLCEKIGLGSVLNKILNNQI